ncbi:MAG: hypothetical protein PVG78_11430 [Desulfobacterales bacterium]|jgi:hypothetical protein
MIYIGNFLYVSNQQETAEEERRHGDFTLLVEADSAQEAVDQFRERITEYRKDRTFFEGACSIFFVKLIEFDKFPRNRSLLLNFKSYAGDPILPFIECAIPSDSSDGCKISDWSENVPEIDGKAETAFLSFPAP